jgi:hypothetical protein
VPLVAFFAVNLSRLSPADEEHNKTAGTTPAAGIQLSATPLTAASPLAIASPEPSRQSLASPIGPAQISTNPQTPASASATPDRTVEVRRALPVTSADKDTTNASPTETPSVPPSQKLEIKVKERTWLRVTKDRENSEPVFNDFVGPNSPAIVIQGKRFWVKALDKSALELRKNGQAVNGQDSDIVIE